MATERQPDADQLKQALEDLDNFAQEIGPKRMAAMRKSINRDFREMAEAGIIPVELYRAGRGRRQL